MTSLEAPPQALAPATLSVRIEDGLPTLQLPEDLGFEGLRDHLSARLADAPELHGRMCRLDLGSRPVNLFDLRRLVTLLRDAFQMEVTGLYAREEHIHAFAQAQLKLVVFPTRQPLPPVPDPEPEAPPADSLPSPTLPEPEPVPEVEPAPPPRVAHEPEPGTTHLHRTLRSGHAVRVEGDLIVYGDVNPGAQVVAGGNIVVLGALKGLAHAGSHGNQGAFVLALDLAAGQVRVADQLVLPDADLPGPHLGRIVNGSIALTPYSGKVFK